MIWHCIACCGVVLRCQGKRSLLEGGIRVPAIWQWVGTIAPGRVITDWAVQTDLVPTFIDVGGVVKPPNLRLDGLSLMPLLRPKRHHISSASAAATPNRQVEFNQHNRIALWHRDTELYDGFDERVNSAGYHEGVKLVTRGTGGGCVHRAFDLTNDPFEQRNLIVPRSVEFGDRTEWKNGRPQVIGGGGPRKDTCSLVSLDHFDLHRLDKAVVQNISAIQCAKRSSASSRSDGSCEAQYRQLLLKKMMTILQQLQPFVRYGNAGHARYMKDGVKRNVCVVPMARDVKPLNFGELGCSAAGCERSIPEF